MEENTNKIFPDFIEEFTNHYFNTTFVRSILPPTDVWEPTDKIRKLHNHCEISLTNHTYQRAITTSKNNNFNIEISKGFITSLMEIFLLSFRVGLFRDYTGIWETNTPFFFKKELFQNNTFLLDYSYLHDINPNEEDLFCCKFLDNETELLLFDLLVQYSLAFIGLHERSHILNGHNQYLNSKGYSDLTEIEFIKIQRKIKPTDLHLGATGEQNERQAMELDADFQAFFELINRNTQSSYNYIYDFPFINKREDVIYFTCCATSLLFLLLKRCHFVNDTYNPCYPDPTLRLFNLNIILQQYPDITKKEISRGIKGLNEAIRLADFLHSDYHGIINSSKIFRLHGDNKKGVIWGDVAFENLELINSSRPELLKKLEEYEKYWKDEK